MPLSGRVVSVNVAVASLASTPAQSRLFRRPVEGRRQVLTLGIEGDERGADRAGNRASRALYAYPSEHYPFWQTVRAQAGVAGWNEPMPPGSLGEHLTVAGVLETELFVGDVLRLPDCALALSEPHLPGVELESALGFRHAAKLMTESAWCGWHLAVRESGTIAAGDTFEVVAGAREVSLWELFRARTRRAG